MTGQNVGYIRVSTLLQNTARQLDGVAYTKFLNTKHLGKMLTDHS